MRAYLNDRFAGPPAPRESLIDVIEGLDYEGLLTWRRHRRGSSNRKKGEFADVELERHLLPHCRCNDMTARHPQYRLYHQRDDTYRLIHLRCGDTVPISGCITDGR